MRASLICLALALACTPEPEHFGRGLSLWIRQLDRGAEGDRREACDVIGKMGPPAAAAVPSLVARLEDTSAPVRECAIGALASIGAASVGELEAALTSDSAELRAHAAQALATIDPAHAGASAELVKAVISTGSTVIAGRGRAGLVAMGARAVPLVVPLLDHVDALVRIQGIRILSALRDNGRAAVPRLAEQSRRDLDPTTRVEALMALEVIGPWESVEPYLRAATSDPDDSVSSKAGFILNARLPPEKRPEVRDP